jgi:hypothetical protein
MNHYEEVYEKLKDKYTDKEIAEGFMIPQTMTKEELEISNEEFRQIRFRLLNNRTEKQRLMSEITRLRISIKIYLEQEIYSPLYNFGKILEEYISLLKINKKRFSEDIDIHYTKLSRILNEREEPNVSFIYRLESHSDELIPAIYWWKLMIRKQEYLIDSDRDTRKIEGLRVKNKLKVSA